MNHDVFCLGLSNVLKNNFTSKKSAQLRRCCPIADGRHGKRFRPAGFVVVTAAAASPFDGGRTAIVGHRFLERRSLANRTEQLVAIIDASRFAHFRRAGSFGAE